MSTRLDALFSRIWATPPTTRQEWVDRALPVIGNAARLAAASTLAYMITQAVAAGPIGLTPALTAMLVMQASATTSLREGLLRMVAVLLGIATAISVSTLFGMHWWSLALVIFAGTVLARALHLGDSVLEVPISAMLILASAGAGIAAENRLLGTLIGAAVGMVLPLVVPPAIPHRSVSASVHEVAQAMQSLLNKAADDLDEHMATRELVDQWLVDSRQVTAQVAKAQRRIDALTEVRRFNSRAAGTADVSPILRSGLTSLEHCLISLRAVMLTMQQAAPTQDDSTPRLWLDQEVQGSLAGVLRDLGGCLAAFGQMVQAEANGNEADAQAVFARNYRAVRDARAELRQMMESHDVIANHWMTSGSLLMGIGQILTQVDLDARKRVRQRWKATQLGRSLPESHIGPRTTAVDRFRQDRMKARQARWRTKKRDEHHVRVTSADFTGDHEPTQVIPVVRDEPRSPRTPNLPG